MRATSCREPLAGCCEGATHGGCPLTRRSVGGYQNSRSAVVIISAASDPLPGQAVYLVGDAGADRVDHVLVAGGHGRGGSAHEAHDGAFGDTGDQQDRGGRVAGMFTS